MAGYPKRRMFMFWIGPPGKTSMVHAVARGHGSILEPGCYLWSEMLSRAVLIPVDCITTGGHIDVHGQCCTGGHVGICDLCCWQTPCWRLWSGLPQGTVLMSLAHPAMRAMLVSVVSVAARGHVNMCGSCCHQDRSWWETLKVFATTSPPRPPPREETL